MTERGPIRHPSRQKAVDHALWPTFRARANGQRFGAIESLEVPGTYLVAPTDHPTFEGEAFEPLPRDYRGIPYDDIRRIRHDTDQLPHWEELCGALSIMDGELLRFVLAYRVNLKRFIRYELACRGHDKNGRWCGFAGAERIWLE